MSVVPMGLWRRVAADRWSYVYLAPMLLVLLVFVVYPIFASLGYTFYQWDGIGEPSRYVGLQNFAKVLHDPIFWKALRNTFVYAAVVVPVQLVGALALALVLNSSRLRWSTFYRTLFFLPVVTSAAVVAVVVQLILTNVGDDTNWLGDPRLAMGVIIAIGIWHTFGYNLVYFLAGLQTIPDELYEAAKLDGAGRLASFVYVTIPMLRSVGVVITILAVLGSFQIFDLVQVLTNGGPFFATEVVNTYIYHLAFGGYSTTAVQPDVGLASAASFFYGLLLIGFSVVQVLVFRAIGRRRAASA
ncbi:carbohydrate ABC transporter permease [Flindersiella endophytica]